MARYKRLEGPNHQKLGPAGAKPLEPPTARQIENFWKKVQKTETCWNWIGYIDKMGYGSFGYGSMPRLAHRVSLVIAGVEIPPGMTADHLCKNTRCVRPDHLRIVTPSQNSRGGDSPWNKNAKKTACKHGHPFTPENTALYQYPTVLTRHGTKKPNTIGRKGRICLTCYPHAWRHAVIPRNPPPGAKRNRSE